MSPQQFSPTSLTINSPTNLTTRTKEQMNSALPNTMKETVNGSPMPTNQQFSKTNFTLSSLLSLHPNSSENVSPPDPSMHTTSSPPPNSTPYVSAMFTPLFYQNWNAFNFMLMHQHKLFFPAPGPMLLHPAMLPGNQPSTSYPHQSHAAQVKPHDPRLITISLSNEAIWKDIGAQVMEMMLTNDGRQINPKVIVSVKHLQDDCLYEIGMKLVLQSQNRFQVSKVKENGEVKEYWEEVTQKNREEVEKETIEIFFGDKSGAVMQKRPQILPAKIYNLGNENRKVASSKAKLQMNDAAKVEAENIAKKRADTMFKVVPQHKYMPVVTLYQVYGFNVRHPVAQVSFPEAQFIAVSEYKTKAMRIWKAENGQFVRKDYRKKYNDI